jgi:hypothetical protein
LLRKNDITTTNTTTWTQIHRIDPPAGAAFGAKKKTAKLLVSFSTELMSSIQKKRTP